MRQSLLILGGTVRLMEVCEETWFIKTTDRALPEASKSLRGMFVYVPIQNGEPLHHQITNFSFHNLDVLVSINHLQGWAKNPLVTFHQPARQRNNQPHTFAFLEIQFRDKWLVLNLHTFPWTIRCSQATALLRYLWCSCTHVCTSSPPRSQQETRQGSVSAGHQATRTSSCQGSEEFRTGRCGLTRSTRC